MKRLFDTQILIWAADGSSRLSRDAIALLLDPNSQRLFSPLSVVEVAIKRAKGSVDFDVNPVWLRTDLLDNGYAELPLTSGHAARLFELPPIHKDPFDRLMIAQALAEGVPFVTADRLLAGYPGQVIIV